MPTDSTTTPSLTSRRAPWWWRLMQLLTALAVAAYLLSAAACAPHEATPLTSAKRPAAALPEAPQSGADVGVMRFDHSVVSRTGVPESPEATGASVAAYAP